MGSQEIDARPTSAALRGFDFVLLERDFWNAAARPASGLEGKPRMYEAPAWAVACAMLTTHLTGCGTSAATDGDTRPPPGPPASATSIATVGAVPVVAASASQRPPAPAPPMPSSVVVCDVDSRAHVGAFTPTVEDLVAASKALREGVCLPLPILEPAIRACVAKVGATNVFLTEDDMSKPSGCNLSLRGVEWRGRRWIVFWTAVRDESHVCGGPVTVEVTSRPATLYFDALTKYQWLCPQVGGGKPENPPPLPSGWDELPASVQDALCGG